ncbi:hypothetical protein PR048_011985 [Dryococelus australis]|uniref:Uncharacterized protein n=1 Tax=Dryococelus australis TaxID=614101 RepID=A0ABQ9HND2_9NEOP|nr:hypothetical protein PR048_011985 [Dryococelus australis]
MWVCTIAKVPADNWQFWVLGMSLSRSPTLAKPPVTSSNFDSPDVKVSLLHYSATMISTLASYQGKLGSIPDRVTRFSQVGIVLDDTIGLRVFLGISHFPAPSFLRCFTFTSTTLIGTQDLAIKSRPNLFTHSFKLYIFIQAEAVGAERIACLPPTKANQA